MKPSKLMRHLTTKHQKEADKPLDFFERKLKALSQQQNTIIQASSVNESTLLASYKVAYRVAKAGKPHTYVQLPKILFCQRHSIWWKLWSVSRRQTN
ncbi:protein FAM200B-like [Bactrocera tryoni]|uniref:protein FAM200B-like n=1 Tax=Bactrocera tryoni TaxID=59916 RepID=UPI001A964CDB|nr:protein FAM200B-like [Bactrocera tryoni]